MVYKWLTAILICAQTVGWAEDHRLSCDVVLGETTEIISWDFDGKKYGSGVTGLEKISDITIGRDSTITIEVPANPLKEGALYFPICLSQSGILHTWYKNKVPLKFVQGGKQLNVFLLSWHGVTVDQDPRSAVVEMNYSDLGNGDQAFAKLNGLDLKDAVVLVLTPFKSIPQKKEIIIPPPIIKFLERAYKGSRHCEVIEQYIKDDQP